ncbi:MAG TPA: serine hydrolase domain-containing protein [Bryobacteraceae bacterium]|nr:serine hydrolase domain-containing protein [Bryobacteraceae bacterium]
MSRHFAVFFWLGLAFGASPENIAGRMRALHVPGVSIAVMEGGKIAWTAGYGDKVNPQTLFQAASISKPVAAMAALLMAQNGNFTLDEDVNAKLKTWKVPDGKVTLRMLLSHSAGMTVHGFPGYEVDAPLPTLLQILDGGKPSNSAPVRVDIEPGSKWRYSGGGFTVVQQLMMDRMGWAFPEILQRMVLGRIGMRRSTYEQPLPEGMRENAATGHDRNGNPIKGRWHVYPEMAAAGLWTTPTDLAL